ncbi:PPK2 family polyphosphate kinase [Sanyastnella coralliicola]|uniref:PPK2 family polyphosphate kinase n=1 Tax=Sanyastnella coralliicola TaxID=3069118 RepID=UPI0027BB0490|nr:PPK2 family polyphosphate kinase [Longitalea sp. SCSIO 12813]
MELNVEKHRYEGEGKFKLKHHDTEPKDRMKEEEALPIIAENVRAMAEMQEKLYASSSHALLIVFQAMDAAGKDGTLRRLLSGINPQGCMISNFKKPTPEEISHDFLWRVAKKLPAKGMIGLFNRSHYEEVLVCKVHPEYVVYQGIPGKDTVESLDKDFWEGRYEAIREWEQHLANSGTRILKFFLNVSKDEQKKRLLKRMDRPDKHWKFNLGDIKERAHWPAYMDAYEEAIDETARPHAPWFIIPADDKDYMRAAVTTIVRQEMEKLNLDYPATAPNIAEEIAEGRRMLDAETND